MANYKIIALPSQVLKGLGESSTGLRPTLLYPGWDASGCRQAFWIERMEAFEDNCDIEEDTGHISTGVKIAFPVSCNMLDNRRGVRTMKGNHLKVEIAQRTLSDLGSEDHAEA
jgi:hypothetical protein